MALFRYADDAVICCRYEQDAERIKTALARRLATYGLKLNEQKTQLVRFSKQGRRRGEKTGGFDFLGFTFYLGRSKRGAIIPKLKTNGKRLRGKLKRLEAWAKWVRNRLPLKQIWAIFQAKLRGHIQYYGVTFNAKALGVFIQEARRIMFRQLNRRSQRKSFTWEQFDRFSRTYPLPPLRIHHALY